MISTCGTQGPQAVWGLSKTGSNQKQGRRGGGGLFRVFRSPPPRPISLADRNRVPPPQGRAQRELDGGRRMSKVMRKRSGEFSFSTAGVSSSITIS